MVSLFYFQEHPACRGRIYRVLSFDIYGVEKIKGSYRLSLQEKRPWKDIFGMTLRDLEENWVRYLESNQQKEEGVSELKRIFRFRPDQACFDAQDLAIKAGKTK